MAKLVVVENDKVEGTDKHNVSGNAVPPVTPPPNVPFIGVGDFDYAGKMTDQLSDFVKIDGKPVALKTSQSSLNPGETAPPAGKHSGPAGKSLQPSAPNTPIPISLSITDPVGTGNPSATSGSTFVSVNSTPVLLDSDKIDTCDGLSIPMNSTVTAENQDFVSCAE
ncbi:MAG: hypothetical protein WCD76_08775 [Pyrinomonadaceae bacterium]